MTVPGPASWDSSGSPVTQIITYPDGEQVTFGLKRPAVAYTSPQGRYGTLVPNSGGGFPVRGQERTRPTSSASRSGSNVYGISFDVRRAGPHGQVHPTPANEIIKIESGGLASGSLNITWSSSRGGRNPATWRPSPPTTPRSATPPTAITWQLPLTRATS